MRSLPQLIAKYLETGTGDIQTITPGLANGGTINGSLTVTGNIQTSNLVQANEFLLLAGGFFGVNSGYSNISGTPGHGTANGGRGRAAIAAAASTVTITNNYCTAASMVVISLITNDATAIFKNVVPGAGSFVVNLTANATGNTSFDFLVIST